MIKHADVIEAIPVDAKDGLIQVVDVPGHSAVAVLYAPDSDGEIKEAICGLKEAFPTFNVFQHRTAIVVEEKDANK